MNALEHLATSADPFGVSPDLEAACDAARLHASVEDLIQIAAKLSAAAARVRRASTALDAETAIADVVAIGREVESWRDQYPEADRPDGGVA